MEKKITIIGDMMCEPRVLKTHKTKNGYDFSGIYKNVQSFFENSDYIIGNLETPLAGEQAGYVNGMYSFNAPDCFADAAKDAGIDLVLTANNHCLDRGMDGLLRTIQVLDEKQIAHTGTFMSGKERQEAYYAQIGDVKVAVISYTYGANYLLKKNRISSENEDCINFLFAPYIDICKNPKQTKEPKAKRLKQFMRKFLKHEEIIALKKFLGMEHNKPMVDDYIDEDLCAPYVQKMENDIGTAKQNADIVLFCPHVGGQFNIRPGKASDYVINKAIAAGADVIMASHAHIVQKAECKNGVPCFYSLGNFSMLPNSVILIHDHLPNFGLAVHLYIDNKQVNKITFSILKIVESKKQRLTVYPVDELYVQADPSEKNELEKQVCQIYKTITQRNLIGDIIRNEYEFE